MLGAVESEAGEERAAARAGYYARVANNPPNVALVEALRRFEAEEALRPRRRERAAPLAVDLGCGQGRDTLELLRRGWRVLAIDALPEAIELLRANPALNHPERLETRVGSFQEASWPQPHLIHSSFALPFTPVVDFPIVWQHIVDSLPRGGRFSGTLFGDRDEWARPGGGSRTWGASVHHTRADVDALLEALEVELLDERDSPDVTTVAGGPKRFHVFHVVVRKR